MSDHRSRFHTTSWSLIASAARGREADDSDVQRDAADALQRMCGIYWYPIYSFVRRSGRRQHEAEDITQGFFTRLLEKNYLGDYDHDRGRFRTFLLASLKHYMANEHARHMAEKRGGAVSHLSLDIEQAESRYATEPVEGWTPESIFDRNWALSLLRDVLDGLEREYTERGKGDWFAALRPQLTGRAEGETMAEIAARLGTSPGAVKVAAHRLRAAYKERLRQAVADTLDGESEIDQERTLLLNALAGK